MCPHIFVNFICKKDDDAKTYGCNIYLCHHNKEYLHGVLGNRCECSKHIYLFSDVGFGK
jgi:hypothetical protein